jgi:hypothetical protein
MVFGRTGNRRLTAMARRMAAAVVMMETAGKRIALTGG